MAPSCPPVIIIGMHRSGTTMIAQLLEALGLFVGARKDKNHEAVFFHRINEWFISQTGGHWDHPELIHDLIANQEIRNLVTDYVRRYLMNSPRTISFLGWRKYVSYQSPFALDIPWGWKSPLNTYTLPLWLDLFPHSKVLHIFRHGVDVAQSLRARGRREMRLTRSQELYNKIRFLHWLRPKPGTFIESVRCDSLEGGLSLWEEFLAEARGHLRKLNERAMEIKYEDFLSQPIPILKHLAPFCGLPVDDAAIALLASQVNNARAYAYRRNPELRTFADQEQKRLLAQGYH